MRFFSFARSPLEDQNARNQIVSGSDQFQHDSFIKAAEAAILF